MEPSALDIVENYIASPEFMSGMIDSAAGTVWRH